MSRTSNVEVLSQTEFFRGLSDEDLETFMSVSREVEFPADHVIFQEHAPAKDVYLILSGQVSLVICAPGVDCRQIMQVGAGELIGWSPVLERPRLSDTAKTITPVTALVFDGAELLRICTESPRLGFQFMRRTAHAMAERLNATRLQLLEAGGIRLPEVAIETD